MLTYKINDVLNRQHNRSKQPITTIPKKEVLLILSYLGLQSTVPTKQVKACINTFKPLFSPSCNWRFAPKLSDVRNQMCRATITCRLSRIDQENVSSKVDQWKSRYDREKLYFRPHLHEDTHEDDIQQNSEIDSEMNDEGQRKAFTSQGIERAGVEGLHFLYIRVHGKDNF